MVRTKDGEMEFLAVEVKCKGNTLTDAQRVMHIALEKAGIHVVIAKDI